ncbi:lasso peptide biosynthesis B2 protein [Marinilongibacter aquaticus]|uniref:lasso peptide biosynthesis B2 protein n=1 Tax=Marinilongibacter aquaticus TaxID=2975157 RepID=UPI0021BD21A8|nr:lasso peptide biosynthesis B2 protein [Marinilongibacter aquaticus]UBM59003.1 lasso peptide biosynthesis B2 protein [Marinilongibacter aquaticus]
MRNWWSKYNRLSREEKKLFWFALRSMLNLKIRLKWMRFNAFKQYYSRYTASGLHCNDAEKLKKAIQRAALVAPKAFNCLPQALTFKKMIANNSEYKLVIGINPINKDKLDAHAWVEKQEDILIGDVPSFNYLPLWEWK